MKNTFGQSLCVTVFGESHGPAVGAVIDGIAPGIDVSENVIAEYLSRRRPTQATDTQRQEPDNFKIMSGVFNNKTTGTPICIIIPNENTKSQDYHYGTARPSHADYSAFCKYHGYEDFRGGGHFSGRITAALVAVGGILIPALEKSGINIGTHILCCGGEFDREFNNFEEDFSLLKKSSFPTLSESTAEKIKKKILSVKSEKDSIGGIVQTAISGLPSGLGEPWFDSFEGVLSHAVFGIGGIKGIEFGLGFGFSEKRASECNDAFRIKEGKVFTKTNNNGGINGGITNGMPVVFQCAVKPTPSVFLEQETVDFLEKQNTTVQIEGRHDPAIIRRICPVIDSVCAIVTADLLAQRYGTDSLAEGFIK